MTTKNLKIFDELNAEHYKLKLEEMRKGFADKHQKEAEAQALEDSGHKRVIISKTVREPEPVEVAPEPKPKKVKKAKVEPIPEPEPEPEVKPEIDPKDVEIAKLKALLAQKEQAE